LFVRRTRTPPMVKALVMVLRALLAAKVRR
jgi:hypothetical protein